MDEPTNHLDIEMRQALTVALQSFTGALVLVSHDRHLVANTVDQFILIENGEIFTFAGDLKDYRQKVLPTTTKQEARSPKALKSKTANSRKQGRQLRTRLTTIDNRMERITRKLSEVAMAMGNPDVYQKDEAMALQDLLRDQQELREQLEGLENEWLELNSELESL